MENPDVVGGTADVESVAGLFGIDGQVVEAEVTGGTDIHRVAGGDQHHILGLACGRLEGDGVLAAATLDAARNAQRLLIGARLDLECDRAADTTVPHHADCIVEGGVVGTLAATDCICAGKRGCAAIGLVTYGVVRRLHVGTHAVLQGDIGHNVVDTQYRGEFTDCDGVRCIR